ncbi:MAG: GTPase [Desulfobacteraceae bacterium]
MPANLPPQYFEAEKRYREAKSSSDKLKCLEEMLTIMPKHKGTDKLRADLRRRISKLKDMGQARKGPGRRPPVYLLDKEGAGQVALIGPPNTGKSSLLAALTNAQPVIADYPFSTRIPLAGMMIYENVQIQLIDTPPLSQDYLESWYPDLLRRADAWLLVTSPAEGDVLDQVEQAEAILAPYKLGLQGNSEELNPNPELRRKPTLVALNQADLALDPEEVALAQEILQERFVTLVVSAKDRRGLAELKAAVFATLQLVRVYTRAPGRAANFDAPFVVPVNTTVQELASRIHKDFTQSFKYARVWGEKTFEGQRVQRDYILHDGDIVELHL